MEKEKEKLRVRRLETEADAARVVSFFLSPVSFDDTRHTPGELVHFKTTPYRALAGDYLFWLVENTQGELVGVTSAMQNEQQTGGYYWDYVVVHRDYRSRGTASLLIQSMLDYLQQAGARYVLTYTCDLPMYKAIRRLFDRFGFALVGRCPDYYFEGEDRLIYHLKFNPSGDKLWNAYIER